MLTRFRTNDPRAIRLGRDITINLKEKWWYRRKQWPISSRNNATAATYKMYE
jgi:hypothetical protein